ncbi:hypothetical protein VSX61_17505 [Brenneria populi subsp. brevivirga]|uniref:hypothetical protein n=1 Tax=Brenneria populi TaxID=1505588 RepID=UPI002E17EFDA|nr:hypothetical protein [Brenneria populi subsp. brevivirga]
MLKKARFAVQAQERRRDKGIFHGGILLLQKIKVGEWRTGMSVAVSGKNISRRHDR